MNETLNKNLQETIVSYADHINKSTNVGLTENKKDLYHLLDTLVDSVKATFPTVPCRDKCSACCVSYGLPRVTAIEWQPIHKYILNNFTDEQRETVIKQALEWHGPQVDELLKEQARIQEPHTKRIKEESPRPKFKCGHCPFLINNSCSIYPVRPAICRAYGFFTIRIEGKSQLFTCNMAADEIIGMLREKGVEHWALPVWDKFAEKIYELNGENVVSTLPVWLMAHLDENGEVKITLDREPDFESLKEKYQVEV
jgi:Fe-S-cluster containining protein